MSHAANGDTLTGEFENSGCASLDPATADIGTTPLNGTQTITGGAGRFAGASGSATTSGFGVGPDYELTWEGTLTY